jgi:hypothetical protein
MRTLQSLGMMVALTTVLAAAATAADKDKDTRSVKRRPPPQWKRSTAWDAMGRLIRSDDDEPDKPSADKPSPDKKSAGAKGDAMPSKKDVAVKGPATKSALKIDDAADSKDDAEVAFLRRSAACLKLQEIALQTNDAELMRRAEQLSEEAWAAYTKGSKVRPALDEADDDFEKPRSAGKDVPSPNPGKNGNRPAKEGKR